MIHKRINQSKTNISTRKEKISW